MEEISKQDIEELKELVRSVKTSCTTTEDLERIQSEREDLIIQKIDRLHEQLEESLVRIDDLARERSDRAVRAARSVIRINEKNAKLIAGTVFLIIATLWVVSLIDPVDLQFYIRKYGYLLLGIWVSFIYFLLGIKPDEDLRNPPNEPPADHYPPSDRSR